MQTTTAAIDPDRSPDPKPSTRRSKRPITSMRLFVIQPPIHFVLEDRSRRLDCHRGSFLEIPLLPVDHLVGHFPWPDSLEQGASILSLYRKLFDRNMASIDQDESFQKPTAARGTGTW